MPAAAVPAYLGRDFKEASPGLRFGMYLGIWTARADQEAEVKKRADAKSSEGNEVQDLLKRGMDHAIQQLRQRNRLPGLWDKNDFAAKQAWKQVIALSHGDKETADKLLGRQRCLAGVAADAVLSLEAIATAPFTTGLGNEHPLENGFAFLNPYGLPYLPGSGVKGVLRQAARELAEGDWGDRCGWNSERNFTLVAGKERIPLSMLDALFGLESGDGGTQHLRGALSFWDVIPQIKGDSLSVDIMTPHQSHYYQQRLDRKTGNSVTPHDSGQPTPISFLTVPPDSAFVFHVQCDLAHLNRMVPTLAADGKWKDLLAAAFEHAFQWLGFGAKTAVGYGAMDSQARRRRQQQEAEEQKLREKEEAQREAELRQQANATAWPGARIKFNRNNGALQVEKDGKTALALAPKGKQLLDTLPPDLRKKVEANQFVRVTAYVAEGMLVRVEAI